MVLFFALYVCKKKIMLHIVGVLSGRHKNFEISNKISFFSFLTEKKLMVPQCIEAFLIH